MSRRRKPDDSSHDRTRVRARVRTLAADGGPIEYLITERSRLRRRLHLELDEDGRLLVVVPPGSDTAAVQRALRDNLKAVEAYVARAQARRLKPLVYAEGARHLYRGKPHRLRLVDSESTRSAERRQGIEPARGAKRGAMGAGDTIRVRLGAALHGDPDAVRRALRDWYRDQARALFTDRLDQVRRRAPWAHDLQLELALRRMRRTWGTCRLHADGRAVIRLNTHLIKAPLPCLDFVIGHELCHLAEMNHGPDFYRLQEAICPDWRPLRDELRERGHHYTQE